MTRTGDGLKLLGDAQLERVEELERAAGSTHFAARRNHGVAEVHGTLASQSPVVALDSSSSSSLERLGLHQLDFSLRVRGEHVDSDHNSDAKLQLLKTAPAFESISTEQSQHKQIELTNRIANVMLHVGAPTLKKLQVLVDVDRVQLQQNMSKSQLSPHLAKN